MLLRIHRVFRMVALAALLISWCAALGGCFTYAEHDPRIDALGRLSYTVGSIDPDQPIAGIATGDPNGRRVIYIHGTPGRAEDWTALLTEPIEGLESIAIDRPGFGASAPTGAVSSLAAQADAIEPLLVERNGHWPILVGHSLGGPIVAQAAARFADRVGGIVIVAGAMDPDLEKVLLIQRIGNIPLLDLLVPRPLRHANRELIPLEGELRSLGAVLGDIRCPVVIIHGTEDSLVPFANVAYMQRTLTGSVGVEVITLKGVDHFLPWTHPEVIRDAVESLAGQPGG